MDLDLFRKNERAVAFWLRSETKTAGIFKTRNALWAAKKADVVSPEMAALQLADVYTFVELVVLVSMLCSVFGFDARTGKLTLRNPAATRSSFEAFIASLSRSKEIPRNLWRLERAVKLACNRAASPQEIGFGVRMRLPSQQGGYGLGGLKHNWLVNTSDAFRDGEPHSLYADFFWPKYQVAAVYESDWGSRGRQGLKNRSGHLEELTAAGYQTFEVLDDQLESVGKMDALARQICIAAGRQGPAQDRQSVKQRELLQKEVAYALAYFQNLPLGTVPFGRF